MVVKRNLYSREENKTFESSVISYGSQTWQNLASFYLLFESSVISYGSQTVGGDLTYSPVFESSVISYGSQTSAEL